MIKLFFLFYKSNLTRIMYKFTFTIEHSNTYISQMYKNIQLFTSHSISLIFHWYVHFNVSYRQGKVLSAFWVSY